MGCVFYDQVYWHFFTITINYNSSHIKLPMNDDCLTNLGLICSWIHKWTPFYNFHGARTAVLCYSVVTGILCLVTCYVATTRLLLFIVAGTWFPSRCSATDIYSGSTIPDLQPSCHTTKCCPLVKETQIHVQLFTVWWHWNNCYNTISRVQIVKLLTT
jgi:hypothetical protein